MFDNILCKTIKNYTMKNLKIIYGSNSGNTQDIAKQIAKSFTNTICDVKDVSKISLSDIEQADNLIFGTSTWGFGDLQDDWDSFLPKLKTLNLTHKKIAFFGLGDSGSFSDSFVDGMGILYETVISQGASTIGFVPASDYSFSSSKAKINDQLVGLAIDIENEGNKTETRIKNWVNQLNKEF